MPGGPDLMTGSLAFHGTLLTPLEALIIYHHLHSLCPTLLYRLLSSLMTGRGTDPSFVVAVGPCLVFTGERDERNSQRGQFFFFERRFWGGVVLSVFGRTGLDHAISNSPRLAFPHLSCGRAAKVWVHMR